MRFLSRDDRGLRGQGKLDTWKTLSLKFWQVYIQVILKYEGDREYYLSYKSLRLVKFGHLTLRKYVYN